MTSAAARTTATSLSLDHALCLIDLRRRQSIFSDTRMFGVAGAMWQCGLPIFRPRNTRRRSLDRGSG
jgi:hypothetical protein